MERYLLYYSVFKVELVEEVVLYDAQSMEEDDRFVEELEEEVPLVAV